MSAVSTKILRGLSFSYINEIEFQTVFEEVFKKHIYFFETTKEDPIIFDVGAHIGISTLYFKTLFPKAKIICFEPLPELADLIEKNISDNQLSDIEVVKAAVSKVDGEAEFFVDDDEVSPWYSTASLITGGWNRAQKGKLVRVATKRLSSFITQEVDLLKLDIEGSELEVLSEIEAKLNLIKRMFVEFHTYQHYEPFRLATFLKNHNFDFSVFADGKELAISDLSKSHAKLFLFEAWLKDQM